jgi:hypothetical protein
MSRNGKNKNGAVRKQIKDAWKKVVVFFVGNHVVSACVCESARGREGERK